MHAQTVIHMFGSLGLFPSRAFIPAFATSLLFRAAQEPDFRPYLENSPLLLLVGDAPTWFTHNITLIVLGVLSLAEIIASKEPDVRAMLDELGQYIKPGMAFLTSMGVMSATDAELVTHIQEAGFGGAMLAMMVGAGVWFICTIRKQIVDFFRDADESDELGIQWVISWIEDLWAVFGLFLLVLYPIFMLVLVAIISGVLYLIRRYMDYREDKSKVPCKACSEPNYPSACACVKCGAKVEEPRAVGFFGQSKSYAAKDPDTHPHDLVEKKRCPVCASRLTERSPKQKCEACGHELMGDSAFAGAYMTRVGERLPKVLGVSLVLGFIPILGLIPGIIYYRMNLVGPFRRYLSMTTGCLVKWLVRLLFLVLILIQGVPILGALMLPLMALIEYQTYRKVYERALN